MIHVIEAGRINEEIVRNSQRLMIIDFYADWCMPCQMLAPVLQELDKKYPSVEFYKVDIEEAGDYATINRISAIPTIVFYRDGEIKERVVGLTSVDKLSSIIEAYIDKE